MVEMESEGKTVAEAVESALHKAGLRRDQVEVQIVQEAASGFLGMGSKPAKVRIIEKRWGPDSPEPPAVPAPAPAAKGKNGSGAATKRRESRPASSPALVSAAVKPAPASAAQAPAPAAAPIDTQKACDTAQSTLRELLDLMGFGHTDIAVEWDAAQERVKATVEGLEAKRLVGKDGRTLEAVQSLLTLMVGRRMGSPTAVQVDAGGYWAKIEEEVISVVERGVERVRSSGKPYRMEPMDSVLRRLVHRHMTANHPDIATVSEGEGNWRKIVLQPRNK